MNDPTFAKASRDLLIAPVGVLNTAPAPSGGQGLALDPKGNIPSGLVSSSAAKGARVFNAGNLSVANSTITVATFDGERWDTDNCHSTVTNTSRLTANTAGKYMIVGHAFYQGIGGGTFRDAAIRLNGITTIGYERVTPDSTAGNILCVTTIWDMALNDYVELVLQQDSGGAITVFGATAAGDFTLEFEMIFLGT